MTADIKPYPAYKDSGVPWLGQVPKHWELRSLRASANVEKGRLPRNLLESGRQPEGSVPYLSMSFLRSSTESASEYAAYQPDLVLVDRGETILLWDGANAGEFLKAKAGVVSSTAARVRPRAVDQQFFFYACRLVEPTLRALTVGMGIPHVDGDVLKGLRLPIPPTTEQVAIVRYLDHADRKVRRAIRMRQQLIKLLTEQKQAIIQRAVTRGLDPNVRLKSSGVAWLGDVPGHWEVSPWRRLFDDVYRYPTYYDIKYVESGIPEVRGEALVDGNIVELPDQRYIAQDTNKAFPRTILREGDIVMSVRGTMGKIGVVGEKHVGANITANLLRLSPRREIMHSYYLSWLLRSHGFLYELERVSPQTTIKTVTMSQLGGLRLCVPPLSEQPAIVQYLDGAMANLNKAIDAAHREIDLLREYRTRLIADVVTGKLDVRGVKVPDDETDVLPEELENIDDVETTDESDDAAEGNSESGSEENT